MEKREIELVKRLEGEKNCEFCEYIKRSGFPFGNDKQEGKFFVDTEGCYTDDLVEIYYCPVCGKKL